MEDLGYDSDAMGASRHVAEDVFASRSFDRKHCFLCGVRLGTKNTTREHIFPKFVLHEFNLWEQQLTLINGTTIPYRKVVIPCCRLCNNDHIGKLDNRIATFLKGGFKTFKTLDEPTIFQWLSRILYSILYLELITPRNPRYSRRKILKRDFFHELHTAHLFLNSIRIPTHFHQPHPWSIFLFESQKHPNPMVNFDFKDNPLLLTAAIRLNDVSVVAALQDNGALRSLGEKALGIRKAHKFALHPTQFSEVVARVFYQASLLNRVPKYMTVSSPGGTMEVLSLPVQGLSSKPVFDPWSIEGYARALSWSCHLPVEKLYYPGKGVMTFLYDERGAPKHIPADKTIIVRKPK